MDGVPLTTAGLAGWVEALSTLPGDVSDAERVDRIRLLEEVKGAIAAAQAREAVALRQSVVDAEAADGVPAERRGRGVAAQVALGRIGEWRATLVCRETACLSVGDRREVDRRVTGRLAHLSDRGVTVLARGEAYRVDPGSVVRRSARAVADRRVTIRPAPDTMAVVSAVLPAAQGVAVYAALSRAADAARAGGDARGRGQMMADSLVTSVTGQPGPAQTPVEIQLVMTDRALLHGHHAPVDIVGYGPVPAGVARGIVAGLHPDTKVWTRRLFADPNTGELVAMESKRRLFPAGVRRFLFARDQSCRTPWCGAPIRHADHVRPHHAGGSTSAGNGQGLCERCNQNKEAPGWRQTVHEGAIVTVTPTGHHYSSTAPPLPGGNVLIELPPTEPRSSPRAA
jgi:hypothetical protein